MDALIKSYTVVVPCLSFQVPQKGGWKSWQKYVYLDEIFHLDILLSGISLLTTYKQPWFLKANQQAPIKAKVLSAMNLGLTALK